MKYDTELRAITLELMQSTATNRVRDRLVVPRPVLVHQEPLADRIRAEAQQPEIRQLVDRQGFDGLLQGAEREHLLQVASELGNRG